MNRKLATTLSITSTAAAIFAFAAIASGTAYADGIVVDYAPFAGSRTRADVRAEVMGQSELLRIASSESSVQASQALPRKMPASVIVAGSGTNFPRGRRDRLGE